MKDMKGIDEKVMLMWKWWEHEMAGIDTTIDTRTFLGCKQSANFNKY